MASIEARLGELVAENRNLRQWLTEEAKSRKEDHDLLIKLERDLKISRDQIEELEKARVESGEHQKRELEDKIKEGREEKKEGLSRRWQIILEMVGALAAALIGGIAAKWLFK